MPDRFEEMVLDFSANVCPLLAHQRAELEKRFREAARQEALRVLDEVKRLGAPDLTCRRFIAAVRAEYESGRRP